MDLTWMAWTLPTAVFFATIATLLAGMTVWDLVQPSVARKGFLPIATTRGDRFFVGLLSGAWLHLAWLGLTEMSLWYALGAMAIWMIVLLRWG
jgi:predicted small integral membrane protein